MAIETRERTNVDTASEALQATVADLIGLALAGKHMHWNVVGATFRSVHLQLDEIVDAAREGADRTAERMATIGKAPDGRAATVAAAPSDDLPTGRIQAETVVADMTRHLDEVASRLRQRITALADADPISQGILIDVAEELEKQAWMLRSQQTR